MIDGAFSTTFHATGALALSLAWTATLATAVHVLLARALGGAR